MNDTNLVPGIGWAPWIILGLIVVCATAIIIFTLLFPRPGTTKLRQTTITLLVSLSSAIGGYVARLPEIRSNERRINNANIALGAFEEKVDELLPVANEELAGSTDNPTG